MDLSLTLFGKVLGLFIVVTLVGAGMIVMIFALGFCLV